MDNAGVLEVRRTLALIVVALSVVVGSISVVPPADGARAPSQIVGGGSTWTSIYIDQTRADLARLGLSVNYQAYGSSTGRQFFLQRQVDFAVSELPFGPELNWNPPRPYAYIPLAAGGIGFMFNLVVDGKRVTELRLSPATIAAIFTGDITNWNDARIASEDGRSFPNLPILPVIQSQGSSESYRTSEFVARAAPAGWRELCRRNRLDPCVPTSSYPDLPNSRRATGSDGVANLVADPRSNGAITYVGYGYALQRGFPVVSVRNVAGYYTQPTSGSVQAALASARFRADGTLDLDDVYLSPAVLAYPLVTYALAIVPIATDESFTAAKGETLARFLSYAVCEGQAKAKQLGYARLPRVVVSAALAKIRALPGAPTERTVGGCLSLAQFPPRITLGSAEIREDTGAPLAVELPVRLSYPASRPVTIDYRTVVVDDPLAFPPYAAPPVDYPYTEGTVTFTPGQTQASATLLVNDDTEREYDEFIILAFDNPTNAVLDSANGLGLASIRAYDND